MIKKCMSSGEYASKQGICCPFCGLPEVEVINPHFSEDEKTSHIYVKVQCQVCGREFREIYKLIGYEV